MDDDENERRVLSRLAHPSRIGSDGDVGRGSGSGSEYSARIANSKSAHVFQMRQRRMDRRAGPGESERDGRGRADGRGGRKERGGTRETCSGRGNEAAAAAASCCCC